MTQPIKLDTSGSQFIISIDKDYVDKEDLLALIDNLRTEHLVRKMDLGEDIEALGREIKAKWWKKNKDRFIPKEEQ